MTASSIAEERIELQDGQGLTDLRNGESGKRQVSQWNPHRRPGKPLYALRLLLNYYQRLIRVDSVTLLDVDLLDDTVYGGMYLVLHLHGLHNEDGISG